MMLEVSEVTFDIGHTYRSPNNHNMFRSVSRLLPAFGVRMASTVAMKPVAGLQAQLTNPLMFQIKQKVQFINPTPTPAPNQSFGILQQIVEKIEPVSESNSTEMIMTSVLRKRRLKMKKHKLRKRRKAQRALRIRIGK